MEDSLYEEHLGLPADGAASTMVNSPTTDTLDSVALETSPTDEQDLEEEELLSENQTDKENDDSFGITIDPKNLASPSDISIDLNTSSILSAAEPLTVFSQQNEVKGSEAFDDHRSEPQSISSYFANEGSGDDFFDSLTVGGDKESSNNLTSRDNAFDDFTTQVNAAMSEDQDMNMLDSLQSLKAEDNKMEGDDKTQTDVTHVSHREHKISQSEPETVAFEGMEELGEETSVITDITEKDEFESFTAGEGCDVVQHASLVERSNSMPGTGSEPQNKVDEMGSLVQGLSIQGPSVGTTPTQMSPLHTPIHQPFFSQPSPQRNMAESLQLDNQSSVPGSPFHAPDSGPSSGTFLPFSDTDDIFTASLSVSDKDRRFDAWIPSDATRHILLTMATSPPGTFIPAVEQLCCPCVLSNEPQGDPVRDLVYRYMGEQEAIRRQVLTVDSVSQDFDGLQKLVETGCLRAALDLTSRLLTSRGQGETNSGQATQHTPQMLQLWFCRFALMVKLRLYEMAESEMRAFQNLDTPDLYFEFYPQRFPGRRGSMVCFAMRLLHADLPHLSSRSQETLDRLYYILAVVRKVINNLDNDLCEDGSAGHLSADSRKLSRELWLERERQVLYKIASTLLSVRDYQAALALYNALLDKDMTRRADLLSGISRIHLQMGNVTKANEIHREVEKLASKGDNMSACSNAMNKGLSAMCINNFSEAYSYFKTAAQLEPNNTCAVNNMAVCSLYLGRLKDALNTLEAMVHGDPVRNLHEGILFNLCTLYELESSRALHKKQAVLDLVSKHKGDGFPTACLKMA